MTHDTKSDEELRRQRDEIDTELQRRKVERTHKQAIEFIQDSKNSITAVRITREPPQEVSVGGGYIERVQGDGIKIEIDLNGGI